LLNLIDPDEFGGFVATNFGGAPLTVYPEVQKNCFNK